MRCIPNSPARRGFSLLEVMISLAIASMLLTAVASAFSASAQVVQANDEFFRAAQAARVTLNQILTEIRRCSTVEVLNTSEMAMRTFHAAANTSGYDRAYSYSFDATTQRGTMKLITMMDTTDRDFVLCDSITALVFSGDVVQDEQGIKHTVRVTISLVVRVGTNEVRLTGSAAPRRDALNNI